MQNWAPREEPVAVRLTQPAQAIHPVKKDNPLLVPGGASRTTRERKLSMRDSRMIFRHDLHDQSY